MAYRDNAAGDPAVSAVKAALAHRDETIGQLRAELRIVLAENEAFKRRHALLGGDV